MAQPRIDRTQDARLTSLINSMADGVIAVDRYTNVVMYNGAALNILDVNGSIDNKPLDKVLSVIDKNNQPVDIIEYVRGIHTPTISESFRIAYADGSTINLFLSVSPVMRGYGGAHRQNGYVIVLRDITRQKSLEEERNEFISVVSHELRTPIAIAEGNISNAQFIAGKTGNIQQVKKALHEAHEQVLFLADMINDLATLSRAERGKLAVEVESINVHDFVQELLASYSKDAEKKGLYLRAELDPRLELLFSTNLYVREILQNFVTNALKYTESGGITISAKPGTNGVIFTVTDTGIGISKSDQEKVFDKFFRAEDFRTRQASGTGLGLYVTLKLAKLIHAEISVQSELNHGSTFTVFAPNLQNTEVTSGAANAVSPA
jgi:two-component system, OmpR family, phosphate regulon sensor histidine kinase PhoR